MPKICLVENNLKESLVKLINLNVYLEADVTIATNYQEFYKLFQKDITFDLVIAPVSMDGEPLLGKIKKYQEQNRLSIPILALGKPQIQEETAGIFSVEEPLTIKKVLGQSAKILKITAKDMATKAQPPYYPFPALYLNFLFHAPCEIFRKESLSEEQKNYIPFFSPNEFLDKSKVKTQLKGPNPEVFVKSPHRLRLVNSFNEQMEKAMTDLNDGNLKVEEKMMVAGTTMDIVGELMMRNGLDKDVVEIASNCIRFIGKISDLYEDLNALSESMTKNKQSYRYLHSQIITFIGFHIIKYLGWLGEEEHRKTFAAAAFFHDILLQTDDECKIGQSNQLDGLPEDDDIRERVLSHPQNTANLLKKSAQANFLVSPDAITIIQEHHGSKSGRGFLPDFQELHYLSQVFMIAEGWTEKLLKDRAPGEILDTDQIIAEFKEIFEGEDAQTMVETLRYLEPKAFQDNLVHLNKREKLDLMNEEITLVLEKKTKLDEVLESWKKVRAYGEKEMENDATKVAGFTEMIEEIAYKVKGLEEGEGDEATTIRDVTEKIEEVHTLIKDGSEIMEEEKREVKGSDQGPDQAVQKIKPPKKGDPKITEIMVAAKAGDLSLVKQLAVTKALLLAKDSVGHTCLHYAAMGGSVPVGRFLVESGISKNSLDSSRRSPLYYAIKFKRFEMFLFLIECGAIVQQQTLGGMNYGMLAAAQGNIDMLKVLLDKGIRLNAQDSSGRNIFDYAKSSGQKDALAYLESMRKTH